MLEQLVLPKHGRSGEQYLAIESNPRTQGMYAEFGMPSVKVCEGKEWSELQKEKDGV